MKRIGAVLILFAALAVLSACNTSTKENPDIQRVDGMVYSFIVGKVEGNDDLLASVLTKNAQGIIQKGRHAYPGDAEIMGEQYEIVRYSNEYENGALFYDVKFFRPSTGKISHYNVMVVNTPGGWLVAENSSVDEALMTVAKKDEEGKVVHAWKE